MAPAGSHEVWLDAEIAEQGPVAESVADHRVTGGPAVNPAEHPARLEGNSPITPTLQELDLPGLGSLGGAFHDERVASPVDVQRPRHGSRDEIREE